MANDQSTPGFFGYAAFYMAFFKEGMEKSASLWGKTSPEYRAAWEAAAEAVNAPAVSAYRRFDQQHDMMRKAIAALIQGHDPIQVDYVNHEGVRGIRNIQTLGLDYGETEWHPVPGFLIPCMDLDKNEFRIFSLDGILSFDGVEVRGTAAHMSNEIERLQAENDIFRQQTDARPSDGALILDGLSMIKAALENVGGHIANLEGAAQAQDPNADILGTPAYRFLSEAKNICEREDVLAIIGGMSWEELSEDGKLWTATLVRAVRAACASTPPHAAYAQAFEDGVTWAAKNPVDAGVPYRASYAASLYGSAWDDAIQGSRAAEPARAADSAMLPLIVSGELIRQAYLSKDLFVFRYGDQCCMGKVNRYSMGSNGLISFHVDVDIPLECGNRRKLVKIDVAIAPTVTMTPA